MPRCSVCKVPTMGALWHVNYVRPQGDDTGELACPECFEHNMKAGIINEDGKATRPMEPHSWEDYAHNAAFWEAREAIRGTDREMDFAEVERRAKEILKALGR